MATRAHAREAVVTLLYAKDVGNDKIDEFLDDILEDTKIRNRQKEFALNLYEGIKDTLNLLDNHINQYLSEWNLDSIGSVEKSILRLGAYELLYTKLDNAIIINEAVEIAKKLTSDSSPKLINGVLDSISKAKSLEK